MPFITEGNREILQIIASRQRGPAAGPDLGDAEEEADAAEGEEKQVAELPPLPDPQPQHDLAGGPAGARALEEPEPELLLVALVVAAADGGTGGGGGGLRGVGGRAPEGVGPRRARGAGDLQLDLAAGGAALEGAGAAGHGAADADADAGAVQARQVVPGAAAAGAAAGPVLGLVAHVAVGSSRRLRGRTAWTLKLVAGGRARFGVPRLGGDVIVWRDC